ncbi:MAG: hypothetical protein WBV28_06990 [Terracidiphilus sp.]
MPVACRKEQAAHVALNGMQHSSYNQLRGAAVSSEQVLLNQKKNV